jgi:hypothetical protein
MKPSFQLFWMFIKEIGKKWMLWLFVVLDIVAVVVQIFVPSLKIHQSVYVGLFVIGLIWASFETYLGLLTKIPSKERPIKPDVSLFFVEGNEYIYEFDTTFGPVDELILPKTLLTTHVRIENTGLVDVKILSINGNIDFYQPYQFMVPDPVSSDNIPLDFPLNLESKNSLIVNITASVFPFNLLTAAQIAARSRELISDLLPYIWEGMTELKAENGCEIKVGFQ